MARSHRRWTSVALIASTVLSGCIQTRSESVASSPRADIRTAIPARAWRVAPIDGGVDGTSNAECQGYIVHFDSEQDAAESFYSVRNPWQQEVGLIDSLGVAWRFRPHEREAEHVTTGTLIEGAMRLLEVAEPCALEEMELSELGR